MIGALSCILWSLTLIPLIKYAWIVLRAGSDVGDGTCIPESFDIGGTLVLYKLLHRALHFEKYEKLQDTECDDYLTLRENGEVECEELHVITPEPPSERSWIGGIKVFRVGLLIWSLFGASCVIADGLLTPAVSVISATTGSPPPRWIVLANSRSCSTIPGSQPSHRPLIDHRHHRTCIFPQRLSNGSS